MRHLCFDEFYGGCVPPSHRDLGGRSYIQIYWLEQTEPLFDCLFSLAVTFRGVGGSSIQAFLSKGWQTFWEEGSKEPVGGLGEKKAWSLQLWLFEHRELAVHTLTGQSVPNWTWESADKRAQEYIKYHGGGGMWEAVRWYSSSTYAC